MSFQFNADEIFEMAIGIEKNGALFYRNAAQKIEDRELREFLLELADMEDDHEKTFASLKSDLTGGEKESTVFDPQGESISYLKALADTRVFFEKDIDTSTTAGIFKSAVIAEKDSIAFYLGLKDMVSQKHGKEKIDAIIKEEMHHIRILSEKLKKYVS